MKDNQFDLHLCGDYQYTLFVAGYAEIMGYTGQAKELTMVQHALRSRLSRIAMP